MQFKATSGPIHLAIDSLGATLTELKIHSQNIISPYEHTGIIGRTCNRIRDGFTLNNQRYTLPLNDNACSLHGGIIGFDKKEWTANILSPTCVEYTYISASMEEGYPGKVETRVKYSLDTISTNQSDLTLHMESILIGDDDTVVNLTNHTYWNLNGDHDISSHVLEIPTSQVLEFDKDQIPTGKLMESCDAFDFRKGKQVGKYGYDHFFLFDNEKRDLLRFCSLNAGEVRLEMHSDALGFQVYSGKHFGFKAIALEPSFPPNAVNNKWRKHVVLTPSNREWKQIIVYKLFY